MPPGLAPRLPAGATHQPAIGVRGIFPAEGVEQPPISIFKLRRYRPVQGLFFAVKA